MQTNIVLTNLDKADILKRTDELLSECKAILESLQPRHFIGAGLQYISLSARQVFWQSVQTGDDNSLGWSNIENWGWLVKHQREVNRLYDYCICVSDLMAQGASLVIINHECSSCEPEVSVGSSLLTEGVRSLYQWLSQ